MRAEAKRAAKGHSVDGSVATILLAHRLSGLTKQPFPLDLRTLSWQQSRALHTILAGYHEESHHG